jgi:hypothetical protein
MARKGPADVERRVKVLAGCNARVADGRMHLPKIIPYVPAAGNTHAATSELQIEFQHHQ